MCISERFRSITWGFMSGPWVFKNFKRCSTGLGVPMGFPGVSRSVSEAFQSDPECFGEFKMRSREFQGVSGDFSGSQGCFRGFQRRSMIFQWVFTGVFGWFQGRSRGFIPAIA